MIALMGLLVAALLMATANLVGNDLIFLAGSALFLISSVGYFRRSK